MQIDYDEGVSSETMSIEEFNAIDNGLPEITGVNSVTIYSIKQAELSDYCPKHQGNVVIDERVLSYKEDCDCV